LVPAINGSIPAAPGGGHSSQDGTVLDPAADDTADDDAPGLVVVDVVVAGEAVDDDVPALVGAVNVATAGDVEVDGVAVVAGKLTAPPVVRLVPATPAVCAAAGPASAIRRGTAMRNSRAMALSNSYLTNCYEAPAPIIPADASVRCGSSWSHDHRDPTPPRQASTRPEERDTSIGEAGDVSVGDLQVCVSAYSR
jgi:hypothetical protein